MQLVVSSAPISASQPTKYSGAARLVGGLVVVVGLSSTPLATPASQVCAGSVVCAALLFRRPSPRKLLRRAALALPMIASLLLPLALGGDIQRALLLGARAVCSLLLVLTFTHDLHPAQLPGALAALRLPAPLVAIMSTMVRQLAEIRAQGQRIALSRKLRGASGATIGAQAIAGLFASTARRADRVELAVRLRGASPLPVNPEAIGSKDLLLLAFSLLLALAPLATRTAWPG